MKNNNLIAIIIVFLSILISSCKNDQKTTRIIILHTNDMHAKLKNLAKVKAIKDDLIAKGEIVYLVSSGDIFSGNPVVDRYPQKGFPMVDVMNQVGYNVTAIGNHEFDYSLDTLKSLMKLAKFEFICANIDASKTTFGQPAPYKIFSTEKGISIALLGLLQLNEDGFPATLPSNIQGLKFINGIEAAGDYLKLKSKHNAFIALSHLGLETDKELAKKYGDFDLIIGGHSHTLLDTALWVNNTMIAQAGSNAEYLGKITLEFSGSSLVKKQYQIIKLDTVAKTDSAVYQLAMHYESNPVFAEVVGFAEEDITGEEELGSFMMDAVVSGLKVDFAFQNSGGIRVSKLEKGDITIGDIYKLSPFDNEFVIYKLTFDEVKSLLFHASEKKGKVDLRVAGMKYTVTKQGDKITDVQLTDLRGIPLNKSKIFKIATNDYVATKYKFNHKDSGTYSGYRQNQLLLDYLKIQKRINYKGVVRTKVN